MTEDDGRLLEWEVVRSEPKKGNARMVAQTAPSVYRASVPGGWIYYLRDPKTGERAATFVPAESKSKRRFV